jgi:hypothetical protein
MLKESIWLLKTRFFSGNKLTGSVPDSFINSGNKMYVSEMYHRFQLFQFRYSVQLLCFLVKIKLLMIDQPLIFIKWSSE